MRRRAEHRAILFMNQFTKLFLMTLTLVLILIFVIIIPDLATILGKPQPKEGGAIGTVLTLLQMTGIPLICHSGTLPPYPVLNETSPR